MAVEAEVWRPIEGPLKGFYEVSNLGRVRSLSRMRKASRGSLAPLKGRILKPNKLDTGYLQVITSVDRVVRYRSVHRLVANAFLPRSNKYYVNHIDGNKGNNRVSNLEFCTMAENNKHAGEMNLKPAGIGHPNSVINYEIIENARSLRELGWSYLKISKVFGVARGTISRALQGISYKKEVYVRT